MKNVSMKGLLLMLALLSVGCQRSALYLADPSVQLQLRVHDTLPLVGVVPSGELYETRLYQSTSGELAELAYTGPEGGELFVSPGSYQLVCCNFDSETVFFEGTESLFRLRAVSLTAPPATNLLFRNLVQVAAVKSGSPWISEEVVGEPGYLFVAALDTVKIPYRHQHDAPMVIVADAWPVVKPCRLIVGGVTGQEHLSAANAFLTGISPGRYRGMREPVSGAVTLALSLQPSPEQTQLDTGFNIFGFAPGEAVWLYVLLTDTGGGRYLFPFDVSPQCDPDIPGLTLRVDLDFEIPEPAHGGGGLAPVTEDWNLQIFPVQL